MRTIVLATLALSLSLTACKKQVAPEIATPTAAPKAPAAALPSLVEPMQQMKDNFQRVQFGFDSAELDAEGKAALTSNAQIMQKYPRLTLEVEGHCDERGTTEYNLALGMKRAQAVHDHLVAQGVAASRLKAISYGEEAPLEIGSDEGTFSKNRRAEFVVAAGKAGDQVVGTISR